jgi:hypothetical protein
MSGFDDTLLRRRARLGRSGGPAPDGADLRESARHAAVTRPIVPGEPAPQGLVRSVWDSRPIGAREFGLTATTMLLEAGGEGPGSGNTVLNVGAVPLGYVGILRTIEWLVTPTPALSPFDTFMAVLIDSRPHPDHVDVRCDVIGLLETFLLVPGGSTIGLRMSINGPANPPVDLIVEARGHFVRELPVSFPEHVALLDPPGRRL